METISTSYGISDDWIQLAGKTNVLIIVLIRFIFFFSVAVQMPQAGQMTFELPYVIFGLGSTPNFVEKLTVGVPPSTQSVSFDSTNIQTNSFRSIESTRSNLYTNDSKFSGCRDSIAVDRSE